MIFGLRRFSVGVAKLRTVAPEDGSFWRFRRHFFSDFANAQFIYFFVAWMMPVDLHCLAFELRTLVGVDALKDL